MTERVQLTFKMPLQEDQHEASLVFASLRRLRLFTIQYALVAFSRLTASCQ